jgi:hypothetical protein
MTLSPILRLFDAAGEKRVPGCAAGKDTTGRLPQWISCADLFNLETVSIETVRIDPR